MVRGLLIRQAFILLDLALAAGIVVAAASVGYKLLEGPVETEPGSASAVELGDLAQPLQDIPPRSAYDRVVASGLFGDAGREAQPVAVEEPPPEAEGEIEDTELNLRLAGTVALSPTDPFASAFIENLDQRGSAMGYALGQEVVEKVRLEEVYPREVFLLNERHTPAKRQRLRMDDPAVAPPPGSKVPAPGPVASSTNRVDLNRQEFVQELYTNYADLVTKVRPEMYRDASGKIAGVTAENISQVPLAGKLGLQDGDVLQTVNNEMIDSEQKILEMVQKYQNSGSFRIGILRNGQPQVITYNLN
jgi:general secretion pathway protein C